MRSRDEAKRRIPDDVRPRFTKKRWGMRDRDARVTLVRAAGTVGGPSREVLRQFEEGAFQGIRIPCSMRPPRSRTLGSVAAYNAERRGQCPQCRARIVRVPNGGPTCSSPTCDWEAPF